MNHSVPLNKQSMYLLPHSLVIRVDHAEPLSSQIQSVLHAAEAVVGVFDYAQLLRIIDDDYSILILEWVIN